MSEEKMEQVFQVTAPAHLVVKNIRGSVTISPGEEGTIHVTAIKDLDSGDVKRTEVNLTQEPDGSVLAVARYPEGSLGWLSGEKPCKVDFVIHTPSQCSTTVDTVSSEVTISRLEGLLNCHTVSGDIVLRDLSGELEIHSVSGDVNLEQISGSVDIHTVSGDVEGKQVHGKAHLDSVSGDVDLEESDLPAVYAKSVSGDFELETPLVEGPYSFNTVSGDVQLKIPSGTHCTVDLHSLSGRITTRLSETSSLRDHGRQSVEVQGGGTRVSMTSVSGDLVLDS